MELGVKATEDNTDEKAKTEDAQAPMVSSSSESF